MKNDLTFKIIDTNPVKGTVTLRPTIGTLLKINIAAGALMYVTALIARELIEDHPKKSKVELDPEYFGES